MAPKSLIWVLLLICSLFPILAYAEVVRRNVKEKVINPNRYFRVKLTASEEDKKDGDLKEKIPLGFKNFIRVDPDYSKRRHNSILIEGFGDWAMDGEYLAFGNHRVRLRVKDGFSCKREVYNQLGSTGVAKIKDKVALVKKMSRLDSIPLENFYVYQKSNRLIVEVNSNSCGSKMKNTRQRRGHSSSQDHEDELDGYLDSGSGYGDDNSLYDDEDDYEDEDGFDSPAFENEVDSLLEPSSSTMTRIIPVIPTPALPQPPSVSPLSPSSSLDSYFGKIQSAQPSENEILQSNHHEKPLHPSPVTSPVISSSLNPRHNLEGSHFSGHDADEFIGSELGSGVQPSDLISPTPVLTEPPPTTSASPTPSAPKFPKRKQLEKIAIYSGELFNKTIDTQEIFGLGDLVLSFDPATKPDWITHLRNNVLFGLPTNEDISEYGFNLRVNGSSELDVLISVRQRPKSRNYFYSAEISYETGREYLDVVEELSRKIPGIIFLKKNIRIPPYSLTFLVETHVSTSQCPVNELKDLMERVKSLKDSARTFKMEEYKLEIPHDSICYDYIDKIIDIPGKQIQRENFPPQITKQIDQFDIEYGVLFIHQLESSFCYDPEDGYTRSLRVELVNTDLSGLDNDWIGFDVKNQEIFALTLERPSKLEFVLKCIDKPGLSANDALIVNLKSADTEEDKYGAEFSLHLYTNGKFDLIAQRKFIEILAKEFNDHYNNIIFREIEESNNVVHVRWVNRTNPMDESTLKELRKVFLSDEGGLQKNFVKKFAPDFNLSVGGLVPTRLLLSYDTPHHFDTGPKEDDEEEVKLFKKNTDFDGNYLITVIIPSLLILVMILLAAIIACLLSRTSQKAALTEDKKGFREESTVFIKKGVPVIFQEELEEEFARESRSKSPAILREERPPLPPDYHHRSLTKSPLVTSGDPSYNMSYNRPTPPTSDKNFPISRQHMSIHQPSSSRGHHGQFVLGERRPAPPYINP